MEFENLEMDKLLTVIKSFNPSKHKRYQKGAVKDGKRVGGQFEEMPKAPKEPFSGEVLYSAEKHPDITSQEFEKIKNSYYSAQEKYQNILYPKWLIDSAIRGSLPDNKINDAINAIEMTRDGMKWQKTLGEFVDSTDKERAKAREKLLGMVNIPVVRAMISLEQRKWQQRAKNGKVRLYRGIVERTGGKWNGSFPRIASFSESLPAATVFSIGQMKHRKGYETNSGYTVEMDVPVKNIIASQRTNSAFSETAEQKEVLVLDLPKLRESDNFKTYYTEQLWGNKIAPNAFMDKYENWKRLLNSMERIPTSKRRVFRDD